MTESEKPTTQEATTDAKDGEAASVDGNGNGGAQAEVAAGTPAGTAAVAGKKNSGPWVALALSLGAVAVIGGVAATFDLWKDQVLPATTRPVVAPVAPALPPPTFRPVNEGGPLPAELTRLGERLTRLENRSESGGGWEDRVGKLESGLQAVQGAPQIPPALGARIETMDKAIAQLQRTSADSAAVLRLSDRLEKLEAEMREVQARRSSAVAVLLAVGQLREALARAMPYDDEWRALQALAGRDPEVVTALAPLKARAEIGIPTAPTLIGRFHRLAPDLVRAQILPPDQSWWRQTLDRLTSLVTVRREDGEAAGSGAAAIVARVEARLAEDDLEAAVAEAGGFADAAGEIAAPWLADAQARLAADKAASVLTAHVVAQVGARP